MPDQQVSPWHIFKEINFHKLEFHVRLKFHELELQKYDKLLNILQIVKNC